MIRSRRAEVRQDLPLYGRMLGLRHLTPSGFLCFVFLEGTVALGILLALAELVSWWGVLVLPLTVAVMVKLNDGVAGLLARPARMPRLAGAGTVTPPPPMLRPAVIPRATASPEFAMTDGALARGRTVDLRDLTQQAGRGKVFDAGRREGAAGRELHGRPLGQETYGRPAGQEVHGRPAGQETYGRSVGREVHGRPAGREVHGHGGSAGAVVGHETDGGNGAGMRGPQIAEMDATALNGPPAAQHWADDLDTREQRARQSAARRYE